MHRKINSRSSTVDMDKCVENSGNNKYNLVLIAAARAREIHNRHSKTPALITALVEIQEGKVGLEYLKKVRGRGG